MASNVGTATLNFGSAPGTNIVETAVTGQASITTGAHVEAFLMGESTATHNNYEHLIVPMSIRVDKATIVAGIGFTIIASTDWRLTGTFTVHWVWST
jgi:hypothetical protein